MPDRLTGKTLLKRIKELESESKEEKAKACGYTITTKHGLIRVALMPFLKAVLEAENIQLEADKPHSGGREPSYRLTVQTNGNLLVGSAYTKQLGLKPGDEFEVKLGYKKIHLTRIESGEEILSFTRKIARFSAA